MRWRFLLLLDLLNVFAFAFWGPLFTLYAVHLGASASLAGFLYAFYTLFHAGTILVFGHLDNKHRRTALIFSGFLIQAFCAFLFMTINDPILLIIPLAIFAAGGGMIGPSWKALYTRAVELGKEGKAWSFYDAGEAAVLAAGAAGAGLLANYLGYKTIFIPVSILNFVAALLTLRPMAPQRPRT